MGMTIDKAIEFFDGLEGYTPQAKDARNVAVETMRKYQKIEHIIKSEKIPYKLDLIEKVLEDGKND